MNGCNALLTQAHRTKWGSTALPGSPWSNELPPASGELPLSQLVVFTQCYHDRLNSDNIVTTSISLYPLDDAHYA